MAAEGGFEQVTQGRKWSKISCCLGYPTGRGIGSTLRTHYEHILYPYDLFSSGTTADLEVNIPALVSLVFIVEQNRLIFHVKTRCFTSEKTTTDYLD